MNARLDPKYERQIEALAESTGRTDGEVLEEVVQKGLAAMPNNGSRASAEEQRQILSAFLDEIDQLPIGNPSDGFSAEDHDRILYRRDW
ncbi:MAG: hypothetical protein AMXMBFR4_33720 [Candidatus Hydrogenedentota bacterium]